jgi:His-Xaa-Ser system radical SAM maturase HxsB
LIGASTSLRRPFSDPATFANAGESYHLAPFRFTRIPGIERRILLVNDCGEYHFLPEDTFHRFHTHRLHSTEDEYVTLRSKHFLLDNYAATFWPFAISQYRTRKSFLEGGPALHIVVVTLRCDHTCVYCQVSRQNQRETQFDLSEVHAAAVIDRIFESRSQHLKVEFQGGEPLLAFDRIRSMVEGIQRRNTLEQRKIDFVITSTLHLITDAQLDFCRQHAISLSTSLDGPEELHNRNRPNPKHDGHAETLAAIERVRRALGTGSVSALLTVTRGALSCPEAIIDEYARLRFSSIFLRSLSPYGFAKRTHQNIGYGVAEFLSFYDRALAHIVKLNQAGTYLEETYTRLLLQHILTPYPSGYVDLTSPTGAMLGTLVYNYDGSVYASDEGRMLAETGDRTFRLGRVTDSYEILFSSPQANALLEAGIAEALPGCSDCAFLPYCGADPTYHHAVQGRAIGHRPSSDFCMRQTSLFQRLFRLLAQGDNEVLPTLISWLAPRNSIRAQD